MRADAMTGMSEREILVEPTTPFAHIAQHVAGQGWHLQADATAPPPILSGEPETAAWTRGSTRLFYSFEPATKLRVLAVDGPDAASVAETLRGRLPSFGLQRAVSMLEAPEIASVLRGLQAIEILGGYTAFSRIAELASHADPTVARQARRTCERLIAKAGSHALRVLGAWKQEHPELSAIFLLAGGSADRLQILRWMARDRAQSNPHIDAVLRTALRDSDWEVRVTAIVVAARLRASELLRDVAAVRLPEDTTEGVNRDERRMLRSFQLGAIDLLQGRAVPPISDASLATKEAMYEHVLRCLAGEPVAHHSKALLYVTSLVTPLPDEITPPERLPAGISEVEDGYVLDGYDVALRWVPPIEHWLGEELPRMPVANPIRRFSGEGFFIARDLFISAGQRSSIGPLLCSYRDALEQCRQLRAATGLPVRLPTAEEWEMAARGPDARRFPWGSNARSKARFAASPWGIVDAVGRFGQWTATTHGDDVLVCGGEKQWVCAMSAPASRQSLQAVRFVITQPKRAL